MDKQDSRARTIGIAIALPEPFATTIRQVRRDSGDPLADVIPPHVTLLPPTKVSAARWARMMHHLPNVAARHPQFEIELRGADTFRPVTPVVFAPLVRGALECTALQYDIRSGPLDRDMDFAYRPHVTAAHHVPDPALDSAAAALADFHAIFRVDAFEWFVLNDGAWETQSRYPLRVLSH